MGEGSLDGLEESAAALGSGVAGDPPRRSASSTRTAAQAKPSGGGPYGIDFLKEKRFRLCFLTY
jgi:hypothetical protein